MKKLCATFISFFFITHSIHPAAKIVPPVPKAPAPTLKLAAPAPKAPPATKVLVAAPAKTTAPATATKPIPTSPANLYNVLIKNTSENQGSLSNITVKYSFDNKPSSVQIPIPASAVNPKSKNKDILIKTLPFNVPTGAGILGISELIIDGQNVKIKYKNQSWHAGLLTDAIYIKKSKGFWKLDLKAMDTAYKKASTPVGSQKPTITSTSTTSKITPNVKAATTAVINSTTKTTSKNTVHAVTQKKSKSSKAGTNAIETNSKPIAA